MTDGSKEAWGEVDRRFSEFGRIVAERYRKTGEGRGSEGSEEVRRSLDEAFSTVTRQLDRAFATVGDTFRDPDAKQSLKGAGKAMLDALASTASDVGQEIKKRAPGGRTDGAAEG